MLVGPAPIGRSIPGGRRAHRGAADTTAGQPRQQMTRLIAWARPPLRVAEHGYDGPPGVLVDDGGPACRAEDLAAVSHKPGVTRTLEHLTELSGGPRAPGR